MNIAYRSTKLNKKSLEHVARINAVIEHYRPMGLVLTLRQLYYQLVSKGIIENHQNEYKRLSNVLKEARMAGLVDWDAIEDRVRVPSSPPSWVDAKSIVNSAKNSFALPRMEGQSNYVEVWVEKDALSGVLEQKTAPYHIPLMVNRGYSSASAMHEAYKRFKWAHSDKQSVKVLYFGDFDPSGVDMIRDVEDRIREFSLRDFGPFGSRGRFDFEIIPVALNMEQIRLYNPPPNPAKKTDSRYDKFASEHGVESWELDALQPEVLQEILEDAILDLIDLDIYEEVVSREQAEKDKITRLIGLL